MKPLLSAALLAFVALAVAPRSGLAQPSIEVSYDHIHERVLDNGLTVVVIENHAVPIVTIEIAAKNGAFTEPAELNGLSHLYEHMFFKANEVIPNQPAYLARIRELGMVFNGTTSTERVNYFFTLQSHNLREGLSFMADAIMTPAFDPDELDRERVVVLGEYDRAEANPYWPLYVASQSMLWFEHPTRKDPLGDRATIASATVEQMEWMQQAYYIPNNALLVISGAVTPADGFAMADELFGHWEAGPDPFERYPIPAHPPLPGNDSRVIEAEVGAGVVQVSWHGPSVGEDTDATYAADVLSFVLSQTGSRFQEALVESGLALGASLSYQTQRFVGPISLTLQVVPGNEKAALEAAMQEVARMADDDYFTDAQLVNAQTILAVDELYNQQSTDDLSHTLSYWWCTASIDYYLGYIDALSRVTREEVQAYVRTYLHGQPRVAVLLTHPDAIAAQTLTQSWLTEAITEEVSR
jgi:zinc protease